MSTMRVHQIDVLFIYLYINLCDFIQPDFYPYPKNFDLVYRKFSKIHLFALYALLKNSLDRFHLKIVRSTLAMKIDPLN